MYACMHVHTRARMCKKYMYGTVERTGRSIVNGLIEPACVHACVRERACFLACVHTHACVRVCVRGVAVAVAVQWRRL